MVNLTNSNQNFLFRTRNPILVGREEGEDDEAIVLPQARGPQRPQPDRGGQQGSRLEGLLYRSPAGFRHSRQAHFHRCSGIFVLDLTHLTL